MTDGPDMRTPWSVMRPSGPWRIMDGYGIPVVDVLGDRAGVPDAIVDAVNLRLDPEAIRRTDDLTRLLLECLRHKKPPADLLCMLSDAAKERAGGAESWRWTDAVPTEEGFWWQRGGRHDSAPWVLAVFTVDGELRAACPHGYGGWKTLFAWGGEWSSRPVPKPEG